MFSCGTRAEIALLLATEFLEHAVRTVYDLARHHKERRLSQRLDGVTLRRKQQNCISFVQVVVAVMGFFCNVSWFMIRKGQRALHGAERALHGNDITYDGTVQI